MNAIQVQLLSPHTLADCVSRLHAAIDAERVILNPFYDSDSKPVIGRVSPPFIELHKRIEYSNSFQTYLTARLSPQAWGTTIIGEMRMQPIIRAIRIAANGFAILIGGTVIVATAISPVLVTGSQQQSPWIGVAALALFLLLNYGLLRFGRYLARDEAQFLKNFLINTLDAQEYGGPA